MIDLKKLRDFAKEGKPMQLADIQNHELLELLDMLEEAQKDADHILFACEFDGYTTVQKDKYDYAIDCMEEAGRDEPNSEDELNGLRRLIDDAMKGKD